MHRKIREWLAPGRIIPLLTASCAFIGEILGVFGVIKVSVAESIILLAVGLLAIDALTERLQVLSRIEMALARIDRPKIVADDFLHGSYQHLPPLRAQLQAARELWVSGTTLSDLLVPNDDVIRDLVLQGDLEVRFLISLPKNPLNTEIAQVVYADAKNPLERLESSLQTTINQLRDLVDRAPNGQVEVRFTKKFPLYSLFIIDGNSPKGKLGVQLYSRTNLAPTIFEVSANTDLRWFNRFVDEFHNLWKEGIPMSSDRVMHHSRKSKRIHSVNPS